MTESRARDTVDATYEDRQLVTLDPEHAIRDRFFQVSSLVVVGEGAFTVSYPRPSQVLVASLSPGRYAEVSGSRAFPFHRGWSR